MINHVLNCSLIAQNNRRRFPDTAVGAPERSVGRCACLVGPLHPFQGPDCLHQQTRVVRATTSSQVLATSPRCSSVYECAGRRFCPSFSGFTGKWRRNLRPIRQTCVSRQSRPSWPAAAAKMRSSLISLSTEAGLRRPHLQARSPTLRL